MNILSKPERLPRESEQRIVLSGVGWAGYEKLLEVVGNRPVRVTYDRGDIELMSPSPIHEWYKRYFGLLFAVLAEELSLPIKGCGSTTFRREDLERGLEPDECFYLASGPRVHDWVNLDLSVDPPPDLAIEVEITSSILNRLGVYAGLGVPELWRFDGETLSFHRLRQDGTYEVCPQSPALPFLVPAEVVALLQQGPGVANDGEWLRSARRWVRERVLPVYQSGGGTAPLAEGT